MNKSRTHTLGFLCPSCGESMYIIDSRMKRHRYRVRTYYCGKCFDRFKSIEVLNPVAYLNKQFMPKEGKEN